MLKAYRIPCFDLPPPKDRDSETRHCWVEPRIIYNGVPPKVLWIILVPHQVPGGIRLHTRITFQLDNCLPGQDYLTGKRSLPTGRGQILGHETQVSMVC
jgi:hypothetical protein